MSLFDSFDPHSEEIVKFEYQRSFRPTGEFPETVIMTFKDKTFQVLEHICPIQVIATLREGRGAEVYEFFYAEDSLDGDAWDRRTMGAVPASDYEKHLRVALEAASRL